ncbi:MAG: SpoIIE family protein phosphatase [Anaerolineae bacterium]|nr:SpoIIE family protein phosphatase [Anaerolineae bacterium]
MSTGIEWAVRAQAVAGEIESGDQYVVKVFDSGALVSVIDGLGHGVRAAAAAKAAVAVMEAHPYESVAPLLRRCHEELRGTRGVVASLATFDLRAARLTWLGVGNVRGLLLRANPRAERPREWLLLRGGVVGYQIPTLRPAVLDLALGDTLLFTTDGVRRGFADNLAFDRVTQLQQIVNDIFEEYGRGTDDTLILAARYTGLE